MAADDDSTLDQGTWKYPPGAHDAHERLWDHLQALEILRQRGYADPEAAFEEHSRMLGDAIAAALERAARCPPLSVDAFDGEKP